MKKILFVCLGNICRSPMAEGVFKKVIENKGVSHKFYCDSAGTSAYHIGALPDERMRATAMERGIILDHCARQITVKDFDNFDYILAMDTSNYNNIKSLTNDKFKHDKVLMMRSFDSIKSTVDVPDPYYGGMSGFTEVYEILWRCCNNFYNHIEENQEI
ncbi:low molecular weight protein-tyrosine-phosphatase [Sporocytophaga myxococcoides]|nr:low molecular weight protein-tyrosine-phosphatase [Sporocytophaga myxococcoides]